MKTYLKTSFVVVALLFLSILLSDVNAATITSCTFDRGVYYQGETGYVSLTVYNNMDDTIRVFEITAAIGYFYADGTTYLQTFFTNATLPIEIPQGQSRTFYIPFILPANISSGYMEFFVRAKTELWNAASQRWYQSDFPTAEPVLYVESPYKQQFEQQQTINEQLQDQIDEQENTINQLQEQLGNLQISYNNMTLMVYILIAITIALVIVMAFLMRFIWKPRIAPKPMPQ